MANVKIDLLKSKSDQGDQGNQSNQGNQGNQGKPPKPKHDFLKLVMTGIAFALVFSLSLYILNIVLDSAFKDNAINAFWLLILSIWLTIEVISKRQLAKEHRLLLIKMTGLEILLKDRIVMENNNNNEDTTRDNKKACP